VAKRIKIGSLIGFPLGDGHLSYLHFIGPGIYGDAVRVLEGLYTEPLAIEHAVQLSGRPERFIAQTFVRTLVNETPGAEIVAVVESRKSWEIAPFWISSPAPATFLDRWVIRWVVSPDGTEEDHHDHFRMSDFLKEFPGVDAENLPGTDVVGEGLLQEMIRAEWRPAYGDFIKWERSQDPRHT
jgi:hypothetical protein